MMYPYSPYHLAIWKNKVALYFLKEQLLGQVVEIRQDAGHCVILYSMLFFFFLKKGKSRWIHTCMCIKCLRKILNLITVACRQGNWVAGEQMRGQHLSPKGPFSPESWLLSVFKYSLHWGRQDLDVLEYSFALPSQRKQSIILSSVPHFLEHNEDFLSCLYFKNCYLFSFKFC